jgi:hypothetical protein
MPRPDDLPDALAPLARRQALEISDLRWSYDVGQLINILDQELGLKSDASVERGSPEPLLRRHPTEQEKSHRSVDSRSPAAIKFVNKTTHPVRIYWLDFAGNRVLYNSLLPGQAYVQNTFIGHPWLVTDMRDYPLALFVPEVESGQAVIQ